MEDDSYQDRHDLLLGREALASERTILLARIEQLVTLNETLEKALREIAQDGWAHSSYSTHEMQAIARAALKEAVDYLVDYHVAADRIEALEKALREIEGYYGPTRDIARAALKEGE